MGPPGARAGGSRHSDVLVFNPREFAAVSPLSKGVKAKWETFACSDSLDSGRAAKLRAATKVIYSVTSQAQQETPRSPVKRRREVQLADMRARAAEAAASLAGATATDAEGDADATAALAARLLAHMEAATQRRDEAQQARRERLAAKNNLLLQRLANSPTKRAAGDGRRAQFLAELQARVALARTSGSSGGSEDSDLALQRLVAEHSTRAWLTGLPASTQMAGATLRLTQCAKRVQRAWRAFASVQKPTAALAQAFADQGVACLTDSEQLEAPQEEAEGAAAAAAPAGPEEAEDAPGMVMIGGLAGASAAEAKHACFEEFAAKLQAPATIRAAQALLRRLETRLALRGATNDAADALLRMLSPSAPRTKPLERYPVRVMLCAFMITEHPEVVFSKAGAVEARLSAAAVQMLGAFDVLLRQLLAPGSPQPCGSPEGTPTTPARSLACPSPLANSMASLATVATTAASSGSTVARQLFPAPAGAFGSSSSAAAAPNSPAAASPFSAAAAAKGSPAPAARSTPGGSLAALLVRWDDSWIEYLDQFVVWKGRDAAGLEQELMRMAVRLERSMRLKLGRRELDSPEVRANPDLQAMVAQVSHDHALLAERIERLTGPDGSARLNAALAHVRQQVAAEVQAAEEAEREAAAAAAADGNNEAGSGAR